MEITEVRVKLVDGKQDKLKAFCSITIDDAFVVRDLKIIEGSKGLFVAMPSRKLTTRCSKCGSKNPMKSNYCCDCGYAMPADRGSRGRDGRQKMHADIAHPINSGCREVIQTRVLESYEQEVVASQQPGYQPQDLEDDIGGFIEDDHHEIDVSGAASAETGDSRGVLRELGDDSRRDSATGAEPELRERSRSQRRDSRERRDRGRDDRRRGERSERGDRSDRPDGDRRDGERSERGANGGDRDDRRRSRGRDRGRGGERRGRDRQGNGGNGGRRRERKREDRRDPAPSMPKQKKMIEPDDPPPDDNFGVGIF